RHTWVTSTGVWGVDSSAGSVRVSSLIGRARDGAASYPTARTPNASVTGAASHGPTALPGPSARVRPCPGITALGSIWAGSQPQRIGQIHRVVIHVGIQVEAAAGVADGIGGHEALEQRVVDSPSQLHERRLVGVVEHGGPSRKARFL